jgi:hypothetical protein
MIKFLYCFIFYTSFSYGQTYYGYKSRTYNNQTDNTETIINCDDAIKLVERKGRYLDITFGGYNSESIEKIKWYEHESSLYCIVYFKTNIYKGYIYGGWVYNFDKYYNLKRAFENSVSKGEFFWKYIENAKIDCD